MNRRLYFLSHSSKDKDTIVRIANGLGRHRCWIDEAEIRAGESLFEKIDVGIADSRVFVLFWSRHSASSSWVREELSQARVRAIRDRGFRLVVVNLDGTPLPDHLSHRLYLDYSQGIDRVVAGLAETAVDLTGEIPSLEVSGSDLFQDREHELNRIEELALDAESTGILLLGLNGMGKSALARRAIAKLFPHLSPIWVDLDFVSTPVRFLASIARPLSISLDVEEVADNPLAVWESRLLPEIAESGRSFIVIDNVATHRAARRGEAIRDLVARAIEDLSRINKSENPGLLLIASTAPELSSVAEARISTIPVRALDDRDVVRALRVHLRRLSPDVNYGNTDLNRLAAALRGYPLAIGLAAAQVAQRGLEKVLADIQHLHRLLVRLAQELMAGLDLNEREREALILLATVGRPLNTVQIRKLLGDRYSVLDGLSRRQLFDVTRDGIMIHGILQDYILETLATSEQVKIAHAKAASLFEREWRRAPQFSAAAAEFGSLASFHSLSAGRDDSTSKIQYEFLEEAKEAAIELYRRREYTIALAYLERIRAVTEYSEPIVVFYYGLTLNRLGKSIEALPLLRELTYRYPTTSRYHHALGNTYRQLGNYKEAVKSFRRAVGTSKEGDTVALCSLGELLQKMNQPQDALKYAQEAYESDPGDSIAIALLASIHHQLGNHTKALRILDEALGRRRSDTRLHERAGVIAKEMGNYLKAEDHLIAASTDRELPHTITTLADVYVKLGNFRRAEQVLERYPSHGGYRDASYWTTLANVHRNQERLDDAMRAIERAIALQPSSVASIATLAQIHVDQARIAAKKGDADEANLRIEFAELAVAQGLTVDSTSETLLSIAREIASFEPVPHQ